MKNLFKVFGIIAFTAIIVFSMAACGGDSGNGGGGGGSGGTFTLTDIPSEYNGMYVLLQVIGLYDNGLQQSLFGAESMKEAGEPKTLSPISNGRARVPIWILDMDSIKWVRYNGNGSGKVTFAIMSDQNWASSTNISGGRRDFDLVTFTNGSATKAWSDGHN